MQQSDLQKELKEYTIDIHKEAEEHPLMKGFIEGEYKKEHLLQFLVNVRPLYMTVEERLLPLYIRKNNDLKRSNLLDQDIKLLTQEIINDKNDYLLSPLDCTDLWIAWSWAKPKHFLAGDLYARWLADFFGGRVLSKSTAPYNNTYTCQGSVGDVIKTIREIVNLLGDTEEAQDEIKEEAHSVFEYHIELFDEIYNG